MLERRRRDWSFHSTVCVQWVFLPPHTLFCKYQRWRCGEWILNPVPKFHNDPMVNNYEIVVLLRQVLGLCGKGEGYDAKEISITSDICLQFPTARMFENFFPNLVLKFHDDPTVNGFEIVIYWDRFKCMWKKKGFWEEEGKWNWEEEKVHRLSWV